MSRLHDKHCKSADYLRRRARYMREHPGCAICEKEGVVMGSEELDHIIPLLKRPDLAGDEGNWQALCRPCHEEKTLSENTTATKTGQDGWPIRKGDVLPKHLCHWTNCPIKVPPQRWGCSKHWFSLPSSLRNRVWVLYRPGQEVDKKPSPEYVTLMQEIQNFIKGVQHGK